MHGTRGKVFGVVAALAAVGLLAACGSNDSTAKSTPTLTTTKTTAAASGAATPSSDQQAPQAAPDGSASTERPAPIPSQFLTTPPGSPALTDKEKGFLEELKKAGITPGSTDIAITAANLVCQGKAENAPQDQIITYVTAIAGSDPAFDPAKMSVEQAGKTYFDVASKSYCNK